MSPKISFISHLPLTANGGGVFSVTYNIYQQLLKQFDTVHFRQVVPRISSISAFHSKVQRRLLGRPGNFYPFSDKTLRRTAESVSNALNSNQDVVFFRSCTRWICCRPSQPYFVHTDMAFHTFFQNTFLETDFHDDDLNRIFELEAQFLNNAKAVFFESEWGLKKACDAYSLEGHNFFVTSNGGVLTPPAEDNWDGNSLKLITIAKNFYQKGGDIVFDAFRILKPKYPKLEWHIIGGKPNVTTEGIEGIHYEGFLRPTIATELDRFTSLLKNAFLLIHPTREDSNPLVLIEAAYFGCPSISVRDFAIPELVVDGKTGFLLDRPISATEVAESIERVILSPTYHQLRAETRRYSTSKFSWSNSGQFIAQKILEACTDVSTRVAK